MKQRSDNRWVKVKTINGKRISFYSNEKTEKAATKDIERQMLAYSEKQKNGVTFKEAADEWWENALEKIAYQTAKSYKPAYRRAVERFGDEYIKEITAKQISLFLTRIADTGVSKKYVLNQKLIINLIFEYAVINDYIEFNPCASCTVPKHLKKAKRPPASVEDEKIAMVTADVWIFPFIAIYTGMRKGEILALQWKDVDFASRLISVTKSVEYVGDTPHIKCPKTEAGVRLVPMPAPLYDHFLKIKGKPDEYIVSDTGEKPLTHRRFRTMQKKYQEATGTKFTAHQLRHSYATIAFENDLNPKIVQNLLGHRQISTTMDIYTEFRKKSLDEAAEGINRMFENVVKK